MIPFTLSPADDTDRMANNIHFCCSDAADTIEELSMKLHGDEAAIAGMKREIERMVVAQSEGYRWIPVTEALPEMYKTVLISMESPRDPDDLVTLGTRTAIGMTLLYGRVKDFERITHWMPLPKPPKEAQDHV